MFSSDIFKEGINELYNQDEFIEEVYEISKAHGVSLVAARLAYDVINGHGLYCLGETWLFIPKGFWFAAHRVDAYPVMELMNKGIIRPVNGI